MSIRSYLIMEKLNIDKLLEKDREEKIGKFLSIT